MRSRHRPGYPRRVDLSTLTFSLSSHRHSYVLCKSSCYLSFYRLIIITYHPGLVLTNSPFQFLHIHNITYPPSPSIESTDVETHLLHTTSERVSPLIYKDVTREESTVYHLQICQTNEGRVRDYHGESWHIAPVSGTHHRQHITFMFVVLYRYL